jgi:Ca2+/H+ antiporter, TMEM165/GDT1 family
MLTPALWTMRLDSLDGAAPGLGRGAFAATAIDFFIAEIGDKIQFATLGLTAAYSTLASVIAGTTC